MSHSPLALLEDFPDGAVQYDQGAVSSLNRTARERFPLASAPSSDLPLRAI